MHERTRRVLDLVGRRGLVPRAELSEIEMLRVRLLIKRGQVRRQFVGGQEVFTRARPR